MKIDTINQNYLDAFEKLKALISREPILQLPDFEKNVSLPQGQFEITSGMKILSEFNSFAEVSV